MILPYMKSPSLTSFIGVQTVVRMFQLRHEMASTCQSKSYGSSGGVNRPSVICRFQNLPVVRGELGFNISLMGGSDYKAPPNKSGSE